MVYLVLRISVNALGILSQMIKNVIIATFPNELSGYANVQVVLLWAKIKV